MNDPSGENADRDHARAIQEIYRNRDNSVLKEIYNPLRAVNVRIAAERQRVLTELLRNWLGSGQLHEKKILEIGCGAGGNLLNFISLGANYRTRQNVDRIFREAGFDWREPGCSMCLAMNPDKLRPEERCASTSNRNFEGRQGFKGRTHLVSPAMAAAAAIAGHFVDIRDWH